MCSSVSKKVLYLFIIIIKETTIFMHMKHIKAKHVCCLCFETVLLKLSPYCGKVLQGYALKFMCALVQVARLSTEVHVEHIL